MAQQARVLGSGREGATTAGEGYSAEATQHPLHGALRLPAPSQQQQKINTQPPTRTTGAASTTSAGGGDGRRGKPSGQATGKSVWKISKVDWAKLFNYMLDRGVNTKKPKQIYQALGKIGIAVYGTEKAFRGKWTLLRQKLGNYATAYMEAHKNELTPRQATLESIRGTISMRRQVKQYHDPLAALRLGLHVLREKYRRGSKDGAALGLVNVFLTGMRENPADLLDDEDEEDLDEEDVEEGEEEPDDEEESADSAAGGDHSHHHNEEDILRAFQTSSSSDPVPHIKPATTTSSSSASHKPNPRTAALLDMSRLMHASSSTDKREYEAAKAGSALAEMRHRSGQQQQQQQSAAAAQFSTEPVSAAAAAASSSSSSKRARHHHHLPQPTQHVFSLQDDAAFSASFEDHPRGFVQQAVVHQHSRSTSSKVEDLQHALAETNLRVAALESEVQRLSSIEKEFKRLVQFLNIPT